MPEEVKRLEGLLKLENEPLELKRLAKLSDLPADKIITLIDKLNEQYRSIDSILQINKVGTAYTLGINKDFKDEKLTLLYGKNNQEKKISKATLETLAIIAYKQPITKGEIDQIRGVKSEHHLKILLEQQFIKITGRKQIAGKPLIYRTTLKFLEQFNLSGLTDLPPIQDVKSYDFLETKQ